MSCQYSGLFDDFIKEGFKESQKVELIAHANECAECSKKLKVMQNIDRIIVDSLGEPPYKSRKREIIVASESHKRTVAMRRMIYKSRKFVYVAAVIVILITGNFAFKNYYHQQGTPSNINGQTQNTGYNIGMDNAEESNAESIIEEFVTKMYTVDAYEKIDINNLNNIYPKDNYTNALKKIATEDALEPFIAERLQLLYVSYCYDLHVNSEVTTKNISKHTTEKDGSIVYYYDGKIKLTFTDENKQKEEDIKGQITVNKIDNKWVITKFNYVGIESIAKYYKASKQ